MFVFCACALISESGSDEKQKYLLVWPYTRLNIDALHECVGGPGAESSPHNIYEFY